VAARRARAAAQALRAGREQHQAGRLLQAGAFYRRVLEAAPAHPEALYLLGVVELQSGEVDAAVARFSQAIAARPGLADAHASLGYALTLQGKFAEAEPALKKALSLDSGHVLAHNNLGNAVMHLGRTDEAIAWYRKAIAIEPRYADAHFNLGLALRDWGQLPESGESIRTALRLRPDFPEAHNTLGCVLWESGRLPEAASSFRAALDLRPHYAEAYFHLHCVVLDLEGPKAAIECLQRAAELKPQDPALRFFLGMLLEHSGDAPAAAAHFELVARGSALDRARLDAWQYVKSLAGQRPMLVGSPVRGFQVGMDAAAHPGLVLEFGVRMGASIRQIAALAKQQVHGFDSFAGIPEDWHGEPRGSYSTKGVLPSVPRDVALHAGWFEETLPRFMARHPEPVRLLNIDCDLYSSTRTVLELLAGRIVPGSIIVFDEYLGYEHWRQDEFKAFHEAATRHGWAHEHLAVSFSTKQAVIRITGRMPR